MKMKVNQPGFDGMSSYDAGIVNIWPGHAKKVFILDHGIPVDDNGKELPFDDAVKVLRLSDDEMLQAQTNREEE